MNVARFSNLCTIVQYGPKLKMPYCRNKIGISLVMHRQADAYISRALHKLKQPSIPKGFEPGTSHHMAMVQVPTPRREMGNLTPMPT